MWPKKTVCWREKTTSNCTGTETVPLKICLKFQNHHLYLQHRPTITDAFPYAVRCVGAGYELPRAGSSRVLRRYERLLRDLLHHHGAGVSRRPRASHPSGQTKGTSTYSKVGTYFTFDTYRYLPTYCIYSSLGGGEGGNYEFVTHQVFGNLPYRFFCIFSFSSTVPYLTTSCQ